jgi:hypothetical protein
MPIKLKTPITKEFHLTKSDDDLGNTDGATMITVRQATQGDFERVNDLNSEFKREYDGITIRAVQRISFDDIRRKQIYLTLGACNITDENDKPLFEFVGGKVRDEADFKIAWYKLPPVVADEIHERVLEMNPLWDDRVPRPAPVVPVQSGEEES